MKRCIATTCFSILAIFATQQVFAHGEDKPGPHKGFIRMPGAYHVEVVPKKNKLQIMLLDIHFKNPTVLNSSVKVTIKSGKDEFVLPCESKSNYFSCPVSGHLLKQEGTLTVKSERQMAEGMDVTYPLPLRLKKNS